MLVQNQNRIANRTLGDNRYGQKPPSGTMGYVCGENHSRRVILRAIEQKITRHVETGSRHVIGAVGFSHSVQNPVQCLYKLVSMCV